MIKKTAIILALAILQITAYAQQTYQLNINKSKIMWNNRHTMGAHYGYLLFNSGNLYYTPAGQPLNGFFSMNMNSIKSTDQTAAADRQKTDEAIRTPGFFAIAQYPEAIINVKQITRIGNSTKYKVLGDLTMKGITNPVEFPAIINKNGDMIKATAEFTIHRLKWNIDMQSPKKSWDYFTSLEDKLKNKVIDDEILITLNLIFNK